MSQKNVEILRGGYEWFQVNGTFPAHLATPDFIWDVSHYHGWPEQQVYAGVQGAEKFFADWRAAWDEWQVEIETLHDVGDRVLAIVRQRGRLRMTEAVLEQTLAQIWTFRDGKETRMDMYSDPAEALKAVGLAE
jgi:ketosteroid isomerase-like protein